MRKFEDVLTQCIEDIKAGRATIEDCLARYPSLRERLEPLLKIALAIGEPPDVKPSPDFKLKARVQLMEQIHEKQAATRWPWSRHSDSVGVIPGRNRFSTARIAIVIVLTLSALVGGTVYAAQDSMPGDLLYPVKLAVEQVRMMLRGDDVGRAERVLSFADRRLMEIEALAEEGRLQDLDLAVEKYGDALNMTLARIESGGGKGLATRDITVLVADTTAEHLSILNDFYGTVPEEAKAAIATAMEEAEMAHEWATERLRQMGP
jgi:hypothetical protein